MSCQQYSEDNNNDSVTIVAEIVVTEIVENNKESKIEIFEEEDNSCPICMDDIDINKNCIVTECGHKFHCSCLMKNAATNGFSCPMCRTVMAEQLEDSDDEYTSEYDEDEEEEEMFDDDALTSFRMLHQQIEGEEVEEEEEEEDANAVDDVEEEEDAAVPVMPTAEIIAAKLAARGFTLEDAVKVLLLGHDEYNEFEEVHNRREQQLYGEIRRIIHISTFQSV
jgi:hypothetical protein